MKHELDCCYGYDEVSETASIAKMKHEENYLNGYDEV